MPSHTVTPFLDDEPAVLSRNHEPQQSTPVPIAPGENPPSYDVARIPEVPVTFTFSLMAANTNAMLVIPSIDSPDTRPLYHISVGLDPFFPTRMVTTVLKGGNEQGQYVGGFKTVPVIQAYKDHKAKSKSSPAAACQTVAVGGKEIMQSTVWKDMGTRKGKTKAFNWGDPRQMIPSFTWSCPAWPNAGKFSCYMDRNYPYNITYAEFTVSDPSESLTEPKLTLMPEGHQYFDEIMISVLLLERDRMTAIVQNETFYNN
ncbi:hypothetical protein GALMADRAFT_141637 [Galerina marginata CBS 339.88]|uniref:Uncharacterized protein n=1 Tax=Galerina marginata (strain CBS 339.88) TaxID=685588 RepID=A0A067SUX4_GALM3|nr:hypothetical protein GALMADRAFT_141637 [Galerina marginata CBS 339.88]